MFRFVLNKLRSNFWKVLCLLVGSFLAVGMASSIPVYTDGILQRMLTRDLENAQISTGRFPGYLSVAGTGAYVGLSADSASISGLRVELDKWRSDIPYEPLLTGEIFTVPNLFYKLDETSTNSNVEFSIRSLSEFEGHVDIIKGRMYSKEIVDGVLEVVVSDAALKNSSAILGRDYPIYSYRQKITDPSLLKMRVVGVYAATDPHDLYWYKNVDYFETSLMADSNLMLGLGAAYPPFAIYEQLLYTAYEYHDYRIGDVGTLTKVFKKAATYVDEKPYAMRLDSPASAVLGNYIGRAAELRLTLQILVIPILLMLLFYLFMVAQLSVRSETNLISVLESRGAGKSRIIGIYALEGLLLGLLTLVAGPLFGLVMVRVIGASNGFLEFVDRKALTLTLSTTAIGFAVAAVLLFLATTLLPVYLQSRTSIVQQKQRKSRQLRAPFWQRIYLDVILLAASLYGLYRLQAQVLLQQKTGLGGTGTDLDGLLFLASTLFLLGAGLLFLRVYPYLLRAVYRIGRKFWSPALYASFHRLIRSDGQEQFLMLFLMLSLSIGLFNANAAHTINHNTEDGIRYVVGADLVLQEKWTQYDENGNPYDPYALPGVSLSTDTTSKELRYVEPDFDRYLAFPGIESATRVLRSSKVLLSKGSARAEIEVMAVDPYDFARTAWTRIDLNPYHMNAYMNVMTRMPGAVLVSSDLQETLDLAVGDTISYSIESGSDVDGIIVAFIDQWPGFRPLTLDSDGHPVTHSLIVSHLDYVLSQSSVLPYEVWMKRSDGITDKVVYDAVEAAKINLDTIASANQQVVLARNDPQLQGTNGALTLGFLISMLICAIGFLIYWILSVQARVLQFGVYRAMGMSRASIVGMLLCEQVLVSGVAIGVGVLLGNLASRLFVPLFQLVFSAADQPLHFQVVSSAADTSRIYYILGGVLVICFAVLTRMILRIRIDQAVKLGEE